MITVRAAKYLWDVQRAGQRIIRFTSGRTYDDYIAGDMLCSAVERQFEIIGEALVQLRRRAPDVAALVPDLPQIVGFRNVLAHNYDGVDYKEVWNTVVCDLPRLLEVVGDLLRQAPEP